MSARVASEKAQPNRAKASLLVTVCMHQTVQRNLYYSERFGRENQRSAPEITPKSP
jgi:hypothetical protein